MSAFGLTIPQFLRQLSDEDVLRFVPAQIRDLLEALSRGDLGEFNTHEVVTAVTDFDTLLEDADQRTAIIELLEPTKRDELADRLGTHSSDPKRISSRATATVELEELKAFFGLRPDYQISSAKPARTCVQPDYALFDHQLRAVEELRPLLTEGSGRALLHFPTGVGKTRTAMHLVCEVLAQGRPRTVVWLASGKELLEQAAEAFDEAWSNLGNRSVELLTMWDDSSPDVDSFTDGLLVVGLQKAWANCRSDQDWAQRLSKRARLVVFDEAHQSVARTYRKITEDLLFAAPTSLLGLSATPGRTWADIDKDRQLVEMYDSAKVSLTIDGVENPIRYLIEEGYLSKPTFTTMNAAAGMTIGEQDLRRIAESLDLPDDLVKRFSMSEQYVTRVVEAVTSLVGDDHRRILVFAATVEHAKLICGLLVALGIEAAVVTGTTPTQARTRAIADFKRPGSKPMALVNFGVLTTGVDAPQASAAVIARPTRALVLYSQMVGRAIRGPKAGGTSECSIVTVVDPELPGFGDLADAFLNWEDVWY